MLNNHNRRIVIYYDPALLVSGGDADEPVETLETIKEKAARARLLHPDFAVLLRDAAYFEEVEHRCNLAVLLGAGIADSFKPVVEAYEARDVPVSVYDQFVAGEGPKPLNLVEDKRTLAELRAEATEAGVHFNDGTTEDDLRSLIALAGLNGEFEPAPDVATIPRDQLEEYAKSLGLTFPSNIGDEKLRDRVAEHLKKDEDDEA